MTPEILCWGVLLGAALHGPTPDTTVSEPTMGFVFSVPRHCIVVPGVDGAGGRIPGWFEVDTGAGEPLVRVITHGLGEIRSLIGLDPKPGESPPSSPADTLLSYARAEAFQQFYDGTTPDSIVSLRHYRNASGTEVFEVSASVRRNTEYIGEESDGEVAEAPDTLAEVDGGEAPAFVAGPIYVVNLWRPGARFLVSISPWGWYEGIPPEWSTVARTIARTIRWQ